MGRPEFEMIVASAPRESMVNANISSTTTIAANGGSESKLIFAPSGFVGEVKAIYLQANAPTGATSGNHGFNVGYYGTAMTSGKSNYGSQILYSQGAWNVADNFQQPNSNQTQINAIQGIYFDDTTALEVFYFNNCNVAQTAMRQILVHYSLRQVAK